MQKNNKWKVSYSTISFFYDALTSHRKVIDVERIRDIYFIVSLNENIINALLLNEYVLGVETIIRAMNEFPDVDHIVNGGNWNSFTSDAISYASDNSIGIHSIKDFLKALNNDTIS